MQILKRLTLYDRAREIERLESVREGESHGVRKIRRAHVGVDGVSKDASASPEGAGAEVDRGRSEVLLAGGKSGSEVDPRPDGPDPDRKLIQRTAAPGVGPRAANLADRT